jgi:hypothetical protein
MAADWGWRLVRGGAFAQGIEAEIAQQLERKARSPHRGDAPKNRKGKQDLKPNTASTRVCQPLLSDLKAESENSPRYSTAERM